jgi:Sulfatase
MPDRSAIVLTFDRLGAAWLGPYGNTWLDTTHFNRLAAQSRLFEAVLADSPALPQSCRAWWSGGHACEPVAASKTPLPQLAAAAGARSLLVTDDDEVACQSLAGSFDELLVVPTLDVQPTAQEIEDTALFRLFSAATAALDECRQPALVWIHARAMSGAWDAPLALRNQFADEDDPLPPTLTEPPERMLPPGFDPDELLGVTQAYAGQVALADWCLGVLLEALDSHPLASQMLFAVTAPRGYPLGEHHRVGPCDQALYGELLHVPLLLRLPAGALALERTHDLVQPSDVYSLIAGNCGWGPHLDPSGPRRVACAVGEQQRAIRTPAWFLRESTSAGQSQRELFAKPDDRWEVNEIASRCADEVELLAAELDRFAAAAAAGQLADHRLLDERLCDQWR